MSRVRKHKGVEYTVSDAHKYAEFFPWYSEADLQELADDIKENGQNTFIIRLPDGTVVDGRNRELACLVAGVEPEYTDADLSDDQVLAIVRSFNLRRRDLTPSQRALIAAELSSVGRKEPEEGLRTSAQPPVEVLENKVSQGEAALEMGVSRRSVVNAVKVVSDAPELVEAVRDGSLDVTTAAKLVVATPSERKRVAKAKNPKKAAAEVIAKHRAALPKSDPVPPLPTPEELDHPYDTVLKAIVALATMISKECNAAADDSKLRAYLVYHKFVLPRQKTVNGKHFGWQCIGLRGVYRLVNLAGKPGKVLSKAKVLQAVAEALDPNAEPEKEST